MSIRRLLHTAAVCLLLVSPAAAQQTLKVGSTPTGVPFSFLFGNTKVYGSSGYVPVKNALRHFDFACHEWLVRPLPAAMVKLLGTTAWPEGEIDLRGPVF